MLSSRIRNASTSPSMRPPSAVAVPVRRATCPSTASRTSATVDRVTSAVIDTGRPNESATRPATPAISSVRVSVTQSAGSIAGLSLRLRAVASSAVAAEPVASPAIQPATPRPAVADTRASRAAVASIPRIVTSQIVGGLSPARRIVRTAPPLAVIPYTYEGADGDGSPGRRPPAMLPQPEEAETGGPARQRRWLVSLTQWTAANSRPYHWISLRQAEPRYSR